MTRRNHNLYAKNILDSIQKIEVIFSSGTFFAQQNEYTVYGHLFLLYEIHIRPF
jgi:hypothetical protein